MQNEKKTRLIVLGGGISGLTLAWHLSKLKNCEVQLLEREKRVGGFLQTISADGFLFEKGPKIFRASRSEALLELIDELGLSSKRVVSDPTVKHRYVWRDGKLDLFPTNLAGFLTSPLTRPLLPALFIEWRKPSENSDESVWDFVVRRFNVKTAEQLFDPLVVGIYAGDMKKLSIKSCFPLLKTWEEEHGSLTRGFFAARKTPSNTFGIPTSALFSLSGGIEMLVKTLTEKLADSIHFGQKVSELVFSNEKIRLKTEEKSWECDYLFSALPPYELAKYFADSTIVSRLTEIPFQDITTVHMGFKKRVLPLSGFGYLVPTHAKQEILGTVFDSNLFPQQNSFVEETRLSVMMRADGGNYRERAERALSNHLKISAIPDTILISEAKRALPQFEVGHAARMEDLQAKLKILFPRLHLVGNYLAGASVNDAIAFAKQVALSFKGCF